MTQLLLPGIEEADWENGLGKLHDPYVFLDDTLNFNVFIDEEVYRYLLERSNGIENNVKKAVDNET